MIFNICLEWLHFLHLETNRYIGNPQKTYNFWGHEWDGGNLVKGESSAGEHTICDIDGNSLKLRDVKNGTLVKIRAKNVHWDGFEYLYTSRDNPDRGKYFEIQNIKIRR